MNEILVPVLAFLGAVALGGAVLAARAARVEPLRVRMRELTAASSVAEGKPS